MTVSVVRGRARLAVEPKRERERGKLKERKREKIMARDGSLLAKSCQLAVSEQLSSSSTCLTQSPLELLS